MTSTEDFDYDIAFSFAGEDTTPCHDCSAAKGEYHADAATLPTEDVCQ
jgi:hypothetical protein